jgi:hypothetical protein
VIYALLKCSFYAAPSSGLLNHDTPNSQTVNPTLQDALGEQHNAEENNFEDTESEPDEEHYYNWYTYFTNVNFELDLNFSIQEY